MPIPPRIANIGNRIKEGYNYSVETSKPIFQRRPGEVLGDNLVEKGDYAEGMVGGDIASDATRGLWWRWNHPLAMTQAAGNAVGVKAGLGAVGATTLGYLGSTALDVTSGNVDLTNLEESGRPKGYAAVYATPENPTQTENPIAELGSRWILGRTGKLLPYEQFKEERPDVTPEEYVAYKEYLAEPGVLGGVVKGTLDGIDGPEVRFMGYRVPADAALATGGMLAGTYAGSQVSSPRIAKVGRMALGGIAGLAAGKVLGSFMDGN